MIPYYRPYYNWSELLAALQPGAAREDFESALAARVGARYGIAFAYARSGVIASLKAIGLSEAEVILPAYTCVVMAKAVVASGNRPAFVDIDLADYNMDIDALKRSITPQTRVVVATHMYGYPTDVGAIRATISDERVIIFEDCAQGLLTFSPGTSTFQGDLGLFSFGPGKPTCTVQGGIVVTNRSDLYAKIKAYRDKEMAQSSAKVWAKRWAWFLASYLVFRQWMYGLRYRYRLRARSVGNARSNFDPSPGALPNDIAIKYADFQARIGLAQLDKLDEMVAKRRALARLYDRELRDVKSIHTAPLMDGATYSFYTLRVPRRDEEGFRHLMAACGVAVDQSYDYVLPHLEPYRLFARETYPRAIEAAQQAVNLPMYPSLGLIDAQYVSECTRRCADESRG
jgi:perosamine synthetase